MGTDRERAGRPPATALRGGLAPADPAPAGWFASRRERRCPLSSLDGFVFAPQADEPWPPRLLEMMPMCTS